MKQQLAALLTVSLAVLCPASSFASGAPDLYGITPGMDVAAASKQALAQIHPSRFINMHFSGGKPAGFQAITDAQTAGGRSEGFRVDTPPSGVVTFLSRAVDFGREPGPTTDDLLRDLQAKYGRYSGRENIGTSLVVLVWYYGKDWLIEGSTSKECSAVTLKSDVSGTLPLYSPPEKARNCDPFMRVAIQTSAETKTVKTYSVTVFDERRMFQETNLPPVATAAAR
jgi:hypothetical protein